MLTKLPNWFAVRTRRPFGSSKTKEYANGRSRWRNRLLLEMLEPRLVLSTITWNTAAAPDGGSWDTPGNWVGNKVPGASDTAIIEGLAGSGTVMLNSGGADAVDNLTTDSTTHLEVVSGSLALGVGLSSTIGGSLVVELDASMTVGAAASMQIAYGQTLTDNGTLGFASGDTVTLQGGGAQIIVGGTLSATATTFNGSSDISVSSGGNLTPTNCTFNMPIIVPYNVVQNLAGNVSFEQVEVSEATLPGGSSTLNLNSLGTNTTNFSYLLPNGFTVAFGATLDVGANVPIALAYGQTLTDNGTLSFASGDTVTLQGGGAQIIVGGTLSATATTFNGSSDISVSSGGNLTPTNSTFNMPIIVPFNVVQNLTGNVSFEQVEVSSATLPGGSTLNLNSLGTNTTNFSYLLPNGFIVALNATLDVGANVPIALAYGQTLTDSGTLGFASGDTVTLQGGGAQIIVGGMLSATATTFNGSSDVSVSSGGNLTPTNCTFNMPIIVPYSVVQNLNGNVSFEQVEVSTATLPGGSTLNLISLGTNTTNFSYLLPNGFIVASNATLDFGPNVPVALAYGQTLTDNGTLGFASGDTVALQGGGVRSSSAARSPPPPPRSTVARTSRSVQAATSRPPTAPSTCPSSSLTAWSKTSTATSASSRLKSATRLCPAAPRSTSTHWAPARRISLISSRTDSSSH